MVREIAKIGNPVLRKVAREVTSDEVLKQLATDLEETLATQEIGVAIAAPQIFEEYRVFYIHIKPRPNRPELTESEIYTFINPKIIKEFGSGIKMYEKCLSIDGLTGEVERKSALRVKYFDLEGKEHEEEFDGFMARIIQHEYDHLNGVLFTDKADPLSFMSDDEYRKMRMK